MSLGKQVFTLKTYGAKLYKWSPLPSDKPRGKNGNERPFYCTAIVGSQGEDWMTTYCYDMVIINSKQVRLAYVACDYVE